MLKTRIIPCLLLNNGACVKTIRFKNPVYLGDPINIVRIFNEKNVDELILLDISSTRKKAPPDFVMIDKIVSQAFMPIAYGGGINNKEDARRILSIGIEKIILNTHAIENPQFISELAKEIGSQSIIVSIDIKKNWLGSPKVMTHGGTRHIKRDPFELLKILETAGAGEIYLNMIDRDGMMNGYDLEFIEKILQQTTLPVIACGGAGNLQDMAILLKKTGIAAVAAGSLFVYHGRHKAVLISYPKKDELENLLA